MIFHPSLHRPRLKNGCELLPLVIVYIIGALLIVDTNWNPWAVGLGILFELAGPWVLRKAAKHNPRFFQQFIRHICEPLIREPHGKARSQPKKPHPLLPSLPRV